MKYEKILEIAANTAAINSHSHHREDEFFTDFNLDKLLQEIILARHDCVPISRIICL